MRYVPSVGKRVRRLHALVQCPHVCNLWTVMRLVWDLPADNSLKGMEPEWLLLCLQQLDETQRMLLLMLLWRVWHVRNELTHDKPLIAVEASKKFLCSYVDSLLLIKQGPEVDIIKEKQPALLSNNGAQHKLEPSVQPSCIPPPCGVAKLNFDGSFVQVDATADAGMILRDHTGVVIYLACNARTHWRPSYQRVRRA